VLHCELECCSVLSGGRPDFVLCLVAMLADVDTGHGPPSCPKAVNTTSVAKCPGNASESCGGSYLLQLVDFDCKPTPPGPPPPPRSVATFFVRVGSMLSSLWRKEGEDRSVIPRNPHVFLKKACQRKGGSRGR
jgi:hypothetical protein